MVNPRILDLLLGEGNDILNDAIVDALAIVTDRLGSKYDLDTELAKTGTERNRSLLRWITTLALYIFYARIPDEEVPERVIKDYDDTNKLLERIQDGKLGCALERLTSETTGKIVPRLRIGGNEARTHNPYS